MKKQNRVLLGELSDAQVADQLLALKGKHLLDVGCGNGHIARQMAAMGATVTGIEPDPEQAERNRQVEATPGVELFEAGAEAIPFDAGQFDAVLFCYSLHHIPTNIHEAAFAEAARVLKPDGKLLVLEPVAQGSSQYVMELFHDETEVRKQAQESLWTKTTPFDRVASYQYELVRIYADFDAFLQRYGQMSYNTYTFDRVRQEDVRQRFQEFTQSDGMVYLEKPIWADLFSPK